MTAGKNKGGKDHAITNSPTGREVGVEEGYARWAAQYDQDDNGLIIVEERLTAPLLSTIPATRVLDLGAGTGRYAIRLAAQGAEVVALDQSEAMLAVARRSAAQAGVQLQFLQQALGGDILVESSSFDLVIAALVLCHVAHLAPVAHEAYRALRDGGHFLVTDFHPSVIAAGWRTQFIDDLENKYLLPTVGHTVDDYLTALLEAGFRIESVQEALVRDAPAHLLTADIIARDGDKPFCLVILASKPER